MKLVLTELIFKRFILCVCVCVHAGAHKGQKRLSDPLKLELQAVVGRLMCGYWEETQLIWKSSKVFLTT